MESVWTFIESSLSEFLPGDKADIGDCTNICQQNVPTFHFPQSPILMDLLQNFLTSSQDLPLPHSSIPYPTYASRPKILFVPELCDLNE